MTSGENIIMAKTLSSALNESLDLDPVSAREERKATGRMVAVIVALLMIFLGFYHAWMKKIPVLAGVMVPALIMLLYAAWVMFLAKREKRRRLNAENHLRHSASALSEVLIVNTPEASLASGAGRRSRSGSHDKSYHIGVSGVVQPHHVCKHGHPKGSAQHKAKKDHSKHHHQHHHHRKHKPTCEFYAMHQSAMQRTPLPAAGGRNPPLLSFALPAPTSILRHHAAVEESLR